MEIREPKEAEKEIFNSLVTHPLQSWEWGEFREKTGIKVIRRIAYSSSEQRELRSKDSGQARMTKGSQEARTMPSWAFTLTIHKIPRTSYAIGYMPKGTMPTGEMLEELKKIGKQYNCIFIKLEPNVSADERVKMNGELKKSPHPLFTKYTFQLDITKSEEELLKNMHPKTRYNIRVAQKHNVEVVEDNSEKSFESYLKLMQETTTRQKYYAHTIEYHKKMWSTLKGSMAHLLVAKYKGKPLTTWILFVFNGVLYYPYGASTSEHREVMASNVIMWEAIKFGKKMGCKIFDMWGSLGPFPDTKDPWYGFHRFKQGYGAELVEFVGSYDLTINPFLYQLYNLAHKVRWVYLRAKKH